MKKTSLMLMTVTTLLGFTVTSHAADFNYNYGQLTYDDIDIDFPGITSIDGDGFSVAGSFAVAPNVFVAAKFGSWDLDYGIDATGYELGGGYHMPLDQKTDMIFGFSFGNIDLDSGAGSADTDVIEFSAGLRHQLNPQIELAGKIAYVDYDEGDSDIGFDVGAAYAFTQTVSGVVNFGFGDDVDTLSFGARMYF
ncbi:MAG: hypothetical protein PVJ63_06355 [Thioalkalispiraceae bacterium]|jgi:hypothetical protein